MISTGRSNQTGRHVEVILKTLVQDTMGNQGNQDSDVNNPLENIIYPTDLKHM